MTGSKQRPRIALFLDTMNLALRVRWIEVATAFSPISGLRRSLPFLAISQPGFTQSRVSSNCDCLAGNDQTLLPKWANIILASHETGRTELMIPTPLAVVEGGLIRWVYRDVGTFQFEPRKCLPAREGH